MHVKYVVGIMISTAQHHYHIERLSLSRRRELLVWSINSAATSLNTYLPRYSCAQHSNSLFLFTASKLFITISRPTRHSWCSWRGGVVNSFQGLIVVALSVQSCGDATLVFVLTTDGQSLSIFCSCVCNKNYILSDRAVITTSLIELY